jgi:integrase
MERRQRRATGTVYERTLKDGSAVFDAVVYYGRDYETGKQIRRWERGYDTRDDALRAIDKMKVDEEWMPSDGTTVADLVREYIDSAAARGVEVTTANRYRGLLRNNILPFIGKVRFEELRPKHLDDLYARLRKGSEDKRPLSGTTIKHVHNLINAAYEWAVKKNRVDNNPVERADAPVRKRSRGRAAQLGEAHAIIEALKGHRMEAPILLSIATGMRRGEIAALRESHIDHQAGVIRVCESLANGGKDNVFVKATKTDEPREVPLNDLALDALKIAKVNRAKWKLAAGRWWIGSEYLFTDELGRRLHPNVLTDAFRRVCKRLKLRLRLHDMRHTAASIMLRAGQDLAAVQQVLGHSAASTTLNVYGHVLDGAKTDAVKALDRALRRKASNE